MNNLVGFPQPITWPLNGFGATGDSVQACVSISDQAVTELEISETAVTNLVVTDEGCVS